MQCIINKLKCKINIEKNSRYSSYINTTKFHITESEIPAALHSTN